MITSWHVQRIFDVESLFHLEDFILGDKILQILPKKN
jgi:hypothetical protein